MPVKEGEEVVGFSKLRCAHKDQGEETMESIQISTKDEVAQNHHVPKVIESKMQIKTLKGKNCAPARSSCLHGAWVPGCLRLRDSPTGPTLARTISIEGRQDHRPQIAMHGILYGVQTE